MGVGINGPDKPDVSCLHDGVERKLLGYRRLYNCLFAYLTHYYLFRPGLALAAAPPCL